MKKLVVLFIVLAALFCGCAQHEETLNYNSEVETDDETVSQSSEEEPSTNDELYSLVMRSYKTGEFSNLYKHMGNNLKNLIDADDAAFMFSSLYNMGGKLVSSEYTVSKIDEGDCYNVKMTFENITADLMLTLKNATIVGFVRNVHFDKTFETEFEGIIERHFVFENDGCRLNAVYTYLADGKEHPAALLIPGSGVSDYNETIGILTPFSDIAISLAKQGINSLRIDKRTLNYADKLTKKSGIKEEYLTDFSAAIDYLMLQKDVSEVYLLGHSLGGQIAVQLAAERNDINGIVMLNSTARHMADVVSDQYTCQNPSDEANYRLYADSAKKASDSSASGMYYYGVSDYYWASYNNVNVIESINKLKAPILIINSTADNQLFDADIEIWQDFFGDNENVKIYVDREISHFGYIFSEDTEAAFYHIAEMPDFLIEHIRDFILEKK